MFDFTDIFPALKARAGCALSTKCMRLPIIVFCCAVLGTMAGCSEDQDGELRTTPAEGSFSGKLTLDVQADDLAPVLPTAKLKVSADISGTVENLNIKDLDIRNLKVNADASKSWWEYRSVKFVAERLAPETMSDWISSHLGCDVLIKGEEVREAPKQGWLSWLSSLFNWARNTRLDVDYRAEFSDECKHSLESMTAKGKIELGAYDN